MTRHLPAFYEQVTATCCFSVWDKITQEIIIEAGFSASCWLTRSQQMTRIQDTVKRLNAVTTP